ncbi:MAG: hypothetical protein L6Q37_07510 [Bdellovibrionaceae bacterium]|nr:hypothetical protein [Pseudobdellovibrionaceae bacterium]NUM57721.1 hypothetical protein [Pseudobdellovibrionaceae bacterium]
MSKKLLIFFLILNSIELPATEITEQVLDRLYLSSFFNVSLRRSDGENVLPSNKKALPISIYEFQVPTQYVTSLSETKINGDYITLEIPENHPSFKALNARFKMTPIASSYRVLSRSTVLVDTKNPYYLKPRMKKEELERGIEISEYIKKTAPVDSRYLHQLDEYEGYSLVLEGIEYSYTKRRFLPQSFKLKANQKVIPLTALFGNSDSQESIHGMRGETLAKKYARIAGMSYKEWLINEYSSKFGHYVGEFTSLLGIMPLSHMQNTFAVLNESTGKIETFFSQDLGDSLVFTFIPDSLQKTQKPFLSPLLRKTDHRLYSKYKGEMTGISQPENFFLYNIFQSIRFLFEELSTKEYNFMIQSLGFYMEAYLSEVFKHLHVNQNAEHWKKVKDLIAVMKEGQSETFSYMKKTYGYVNISVELINNDLISSIFENLFLEIRNNFTTNINTDLTYQMKMLQRWIDNEKSNNLSFANSMAPKINFSNYSYFPSEYLFHETKIGLLLLKRAVLHTQDPPTLAAIMHIPPTNKCHQHYLSPWVTKIIWDY